MENQKELERICQESLGKLQAGLSEAIAHAVTEGYKLGWEECWKKSGLDRLEKIISEED